MYGEKSNFRPFGPILGTQRPHFPEKATDTPTGGSRVKQRYGPPLPPLCATKKISTQREAPNFFGTSFLTKEWSFLTLFPKGLKILEV
jgi:hypothetical protein